MSKIKSWCRTAYEQLTWAEVSGSVGDLGTFLPLLIGLVQKVNLDLGTSLIVTGAYNIVSGLQFGIPMSVQPMKTIAAVALASTQPALTLPQLLLAGLFVSGCVLVLGLSRLVDVFNWLVPPPVVRGVQLAVGVKLAMKGVDMALRYHGAAAAAGQVGSAAGGSSGGGGGGNSLGSSGGAAQWRPLLGTEGLLLGAVALAALVASTIAPRVHPPGSEDAAEDGGLGPRPTDTPFEALLRRLLPTSTSATAASANPYTALRGASGDMSPVETHPGAAEGASGVRVSSSFPRHLDPSTGPGGAAETASAARAAADSEAASLLAPEDGGVRGADPETGAGLASGPAFGAEAEVDESAAGPWMGNGGGSSRGGDCGSGVDAGGAGCGGGGGCGGSDGASRRRLPAALLAVVVGLVLAVVSRPAILGELRLGPSVPRLLRPSWRDFKEGVMRAGLPQLPLTTLNSIIAVTQLADSLFPERRDSARWRPSAVALSVAILNLGGCWLGAMPCCHGAGGLAAQYKFGARTGLAPVVLGCTKAALGLLLGGSLMALLQRFPQPLLGALLVVSGIELASSVRHTRTVRGYTFALLTAVAILGLDNTGVGFLIGLGGVLFVAGYEAAATASVARLQRWRAYGAGGGGSGGSRSSGWLWGRKH